MTIHEVIIHNFGIYRGRQKVELVPKSPSKPIILFGGQNGVGKTTLLDALQLALYGRAARCSNRGLLSYDEFLRQSINRDAKKEEGAALEVKFARIEQGRENIYRVRRTWTENGRGIREHVEVEKNDGIDRVLSENWSDRIEEYMPSKIAHLFFFDGEKIEEFADPNKSSQLLSTAIRSLLGVDIVDELSHDLVVFERRQRTRLKNSTVRKEIEYFQTELDQLQDRKTDLVQQRASAQNHSDLLEKRLEDLEVQFQQEGGQLFELRHRFEAQRTSVEKQLVELENELREIAAGIAPFLMTRDLLAALSQQVEREGLAIHAELLDEALEERDARIVEVALQASASEELVGSVKRFLADDRSRRLHDAETHRYINLSSEGIATLGHLREHLSSENLALVNRLLARVEELRAFSEDIDRKMAGVPDESLISRLIEERENVKIHLLGAQSRMRIIDGELERIEREHSHKSSQMIARIERAVESDFEKEDQVRILQHSQRARDILDTFRYAVIVSNVNRIGLLVLEGFKRLAQKQTLIKNLTINPQTFLLELQGLDGRPLPADRLSAGERQLLAVAILWGLAQASGRPLPAAIDTPLGRLDSLHRAHLIKYYFPFASHQVLLFSTDEEISEDYYAELKPYVERSYLLQYDDSTRSSRIIPGYYW